MTARSDDDDALSWGDEDDPTLHVGKSAAPAEPASAETALPEGFTAVGRHAEAVTAGDGDASVVEHDHEESAVGNAALIAIGVLGGVYLLATIGWILGGLRLKGSADYLVGPIAYQISFWLAVAAPALWFVTTLWLTAGRRAWVRFAWLIGGAALLLPWPFIMLGTVGR